MKHLDLFSGIGGFSLAVDTVFPGAEHTFVEIDPFCQEILKKHWPEAKIHDDIETFTGGGTADIVTGGFPCQPFSHAGRKKGTTDDRDLWPEMFRVICEEKPRWIIGENVVGFIDMELERTISDLETEGYEVQAFIIPACAVGAHHRRDRIWIVGYSEREGQQRRDGQQKLRVSKEKTQSEHGPDVFIGRTEWKRHCARIRERDGIPRTMARSAVKAYGNAIVPQVAIEILKAIKQTNETLP